MKKTLTWLLCLIMIVQTIMPCAALQADSSDVDGKNFTNMLEVQPELAAYFDEFKLDYSSMGVLAYSIKLKDSFLEQVSDKIDMEYGDELGNYETEEERDAFYKNNIVNSVDIPQITAVIPCDETYFKEKEDVQKIETTDGNKDEIGEISFSKGDNGKINLKFLFNNLVYNRKNVSTGSGINVNLDTSQIGNKTYKYTWDKTNDEITLDVAVEPSPSSSTEDTVYKISKTAPNAVDVPYIDYIITPSVQNGTLNGKTISDVIPKHLMVNKVTLDGNELSAAQYSVNNGTFLYTYPELNADKSNKITGSKLVIRMCLDNDTYINTYMKQQKIDMTFHNTAEFLDDDKKTPLTKSDETTTRMKMTFVEKGGKIIAPGSPEYEWSITLRTYFSSSVYAYVVDELNEDVHMYETDKPVQLQIGTEKKELTLVQDRTGFKRPASEVKVKQLYDLVNANGLSDGQALYYTYIDESTGSKKAVMLIPYEKYTDGIVKITYKTKVNQEVQDEQNQNSGKLSLDNSARLVWQWKEGDGPGESDFNIETEKGLTAEYNLVSKASESYDSKTQIQTWLFCVNQYAQNAKNVEIKDILDPTKLVLADTGESIWGMYLDRSTGDKAKKVVFTYDNSANPAPRTYNVKTNGTVVIHIGDITENEYYDIHLQTKVVDGKLFSAPSGSAPKKVSNNAYFYYINENGDSINKYIYAGNAVPVDNILKEAPDLAVKNAEGKEVMQQYNSANRTLKWKAVVNPACLPIDTASVIDTLPEGCHFYNLESVKRILPDNTEIAGVVEGSQATFADGMVIQCKENEDGTLCVFTFGKKNSVGELETEGTSINETYEIEYYTQFTEDYFLQSLSKQPGEITVTNKVELKGVIYGETISGQEDTAVHTVLPQVIEKGGAYDSNTGKITWQLVINRDGMELGGKRIVESLQNQQGLDTASMKLYRAEVASSGEIKSKTLLGADITEAAMEDMSAAGFVFKIPEEYSRQTLILQFQTYITVDVKASDVKNSVTLLLDDATQITTQEVTPDNMIDVNTNQFAEAFKIPMIRITKKDSEDNTKTLAGAVFKVTAMKMDGSSWIEDVSKYSKEKTTNYKGNALFINLDRDVLYKVTESKAPEDYQIDMIPKYVVFYTDSEMVDVPEGTQQYAAKNITTATLEWLNTLSPKTSEPTEVPITTEAPIITETPTEAPVTTEAAVSPTGEVVPPVPTEIVPEISPSPSVTPKPPESTSIVRTADMKIIKTCEDGKKQGFSFEVTGIHDGKVIFHGIYTTDANGTIDLRTLFSGTYTVRELSTEVSKAYVIPEYQTIILSGKNVTVPVYNKLKPVIPVKPSPSAAKPPIETGIAGTKPPHGIESNGSKPPIASGTGTPPVSGIPSTPLYTGTNSMPPNAAGTASNGMVPKTGDKSIPNIWLYALIAVSSTGMLFAGSRMVRKKRKIK